MDAGFRELKEETGLTREHVEMNRDPFTSTDAIYVTGNEDDFRVSFHYVITQLVASVSCQEAASFVTAGDDASDARWFDMDEIECHQRTSPKLLQTLRLAQSHLQR